MTISVPVSHFTSRPGTCSASSCSDYESDRCVLSWDLRSNGTCFVCPKSAWPTSISALPASKGARCAPIPSRPDIHCIPKLASELARAYQKLDLPVRSFENEWGPGQVECTFAPAEALQAADNMVLFRTATRQLCRRMGYLASFMCRPKLKGAYPSGWHLHQSVVETSGGANIFTPSNPGDSLSPVGKAYLGGLLQHALAAAVLANPTVNAYRRFRANSLAPDRLAWGIDHRGVLLRVLGEVGSPATRIENRIGEPAANPYLYIASQIISGLDGIDNARDPGAPDTDPYSAGGSRLPNRLLVALEMLEQDPLFRRELGDRFIDYYLAFKRVEAGRFTRYVNNNNLDPSSDEVTDWEQDEYFDFF
jgi:glutamine synthetase